MDEEDPLSWNIEPYENFLNSHFFYRAVHKFLWKNWPRTDKIYSNFFSLDQAINGLSVDWSKYATPEFTLNSRPVPKLYVNGIVKINVGKIKIVIEEKILPISIKHDPIKEPPLNRAHTLLEGISKINKAKLKLKLSKIAQWAPNMMPIKEQV